MNKIIECFHHIISFFELNFCFNVSDKQPDRKYDKIINIKLPSYYKYESNPNLNNIHHVIDNTLENVLDSTQENVIDGTQENVLDSTQENVIDGTQENVIDGTQENVIDGILENVLDSTQENVIDGTQENVLDSTQENVIDGILENVIDGTQENNNKSENKIDNPKNNDYPFYTENINNLTESDDDYVLI